MPLNLRVEELVLVTENNRFEYGFEVGINAIVGEIGSGKSSLLELIKYALGGNGQLTPAVKQGVHRVVLQAVVGNDTVLLSRDIGGGQIDALDRDGELLERLSVAESKKFRRATAFLLDLLGLPQLRVTNMRPTARSSPLSFYDVFDYCYVPQAEIDRSVVHHLEGVRRAKRVGGFELLFGLTDPSLSEARMRIGQLEDGIADARRPLGIIDRFLQEAGTPTEEQLVVRREDAAVRIEAGERRLASLREETLAVTADAADLRARIAAFARDAADVGERVRELEAEGAQHRQLEAQLQSELERLGRARSATAVLAEIAYMQCPRCLQAVAPHRFSDEACYVCGQPEPEIQSDELERPDPVAAAERTRIEGLLAEIVDLSSARAEQLEKELDRQRGLAAALHELEIELDRRTRELVSPRFEAIEQAVTDTTAARLESAEIDRLVQLWTERNEYANRVRTLEQELAGMRAEHEAAQARLAERKSRISEVSAIFDEIIQELRMPWYQKGAYIDARSYLPIVNGVSIEELGSGGMKMMTNVAYHLAILTYGLSSGIPTIPNLLIIDSPRKNLGATDEDQAHATSFYRWITAMTGAYEGRFQLIIADNDPPEPATPLARRIDLSHARPLIPDLPHPGDGVETLG